MLEIHIQTIQNVKNDVKKKERQVTKLISKIKIHNSTTKTSYYYNK